MVITNRNNEPKVNLAFQVSFIVTKTNGIDAPLPELVSATKTL